MADFTIVHRPALSAVLTSQSGAIGLNVLPEGRVLHVLAAADSGDLRPLLVELAGGEAQAIRSAGPGQWFIVGDAPIAHAELMALSAQLAGKAAVVDQSHGRVRIAAYGTTVARMLAKGTAVDLDGLAIGQSATTLVGHIGVHLTRTATDRFELMVLRGFAESLWDDLVHMSAEFA